MTERADAAGRAAVAEVDLREVADDVGRLDRLVLLGLAAELGRAPCTRTDGWTATRVADELHVADRHRWVPGRWLVDLSAAGLVSTVEPDAVAGSAPAPPPGNARSSSVGGAYRALRPPDRSELAAARRDMEQARRRLGYGPELSELLLGSLRLVPRLLADDVDVQSLLYPGGRLQTAQAVYGDNVISRYLHAAAAAVVARPGAATSRPQRVLEVGAGIGATAEALLAVADPVEYLYTDLSPFFLDTARRRFASRSDALRYGIVDMSGDLARQLASAFDGEPPVRASAPDLDLVVAATAAHNAIDVGSFLAQVRRLLAPGGRLVLVETVEERPQSLTTMPFALSTRNGSPPARRDARAGTHRTYLTDDEWHRYLAGAGLDLEVDLPRPDHPLRSASQRLLVATPSTPRHRRFPVSTIEDALVPPDTIRTQLVELWAELLHLDPGEVAPDRSFLRLGGDSVLAVRMSALVRQRLGVPLALSDVRVETTVDDLVGLVSRRADQTGGAHPGLPLTVERRVDPQSSFPLLPLQQGYFVGQQDGWELSYESAHYYLDYGLAGVDGDDAPDALADAVERLAVHQPALRARVSADGRQHVLDGADPASLPRVTVHDLRDRSPEEAAAVLSAVREEMSTRGPNPLEGPGLDVRLTLLPDGTGRLHLGLSLLVFDGWSSTVLNRDLLDFATDWNATLAPLEIDFGDYVAAVEEVSRGEAWATDRDWWWERLDDMPSPPALPLVADPRDVTPVTMGNREMRLPAPEWQAVRAACQHRGVTPSVAMLTAFSVVLAQWAGHRRLLLNSLQLNRLPIHPDVQRVVGAFASTMFVPVELAHGASFAELAAAAQAVSGDAAAHNLVSGVEVGRELGRRRGSRRPMGPVVFQSVLGMGAAMGEAAPSDAGPLGTVVQTDYFHQLRTPQVALEVRCFELGEQMAAVFSLVDELFDAGEVTEAFDRFCALVRDLADDASWDRVPDLPEAADVLPADGRLRLGRLPDAVGDSAVGPLADSVDHAVAEVFEELLEVPVLDLGAHFFELGGDSLTAVRVVGRLSRDLGVKVPVRDFLDHPTVGGVAALVRGTAVAG